MLTRRPLKDPPLNNIPSGSNTDMASVKVAMISTTLRNGSMIRIFGDELSCLTPSLMIDTAFPSQQSPFRPFVAHNIGLGISDSHTSDSHASTSRGTPSPAVPGSLPVSTIRGDTSASGVWAWRQFLSKNLLSTQEKLGSRRLDEARDLARKNEALIRPSDMKIINDKFLQCVLSSQIVSETCLTTISATEIRASLESKSGFSRFLYAREYRKFAEDLAREVLRFVEVNLAHRIAQETSLITSGFLDRLQQS